MSALPVPVGPQLPALARLARIEETTIVEDFLAGRSENTRRAYRGDLEHFRAWLDAPTLDAAVDALLAGGNGHANRITLAYRNGMRESGLSAATANRRVSSLRAMAKLARLTGRTSTTIDVSGVKRAPVRDTRGPGLKGLRALVAAAELRRDGPRKRRDLAVLRLLTDLGLRRFEVAGLDLEHVDLASSVVLVLGKGRESRAPITVTPSAMTALEAWLAVRPSIEGQLAVFVCLNGTARGKRLGGAGVAGITKRLGREAGLGPVRPHQVRHAAVTALLDVTSGDVRRVRLFARHTSVATTMTYDDVREDVAGKLASLLSASINLGGAFANAKPEGD